MALLGFVSAGLGLGGQTWDETTVVQPSGCPWLAYKFLDADVSILEVSSGDGQTHRRRLRREHTEFPSRRPVLSGLMQGELTMARMAL